MWSHNKRSLARIRVHFLTCFPSALTPLTLAAWKILDLDIESVRTTFYTFEGGRDQWCPLRDLNGVPPGVWRRKYSTGSSNILSTNAIGNGTRCGKC